MSNKRAKEVSNIDRLSALPDSVITRILSILFVDESAKTAVLSRRWRHVWTQSPEFRFRQGNLMVPDFVGRVNRTLVICNSPHQLEHFSVEFAYSKPFACDVDAWSQFAVNNKVKTVFFLLNTKPSDHFHVLPQSMCSNSSLDYLVIKGCTIAPHRTIDWPCLTFLYIEGVEVQQQSVAKILAGCPLLSDLNLNQCWGFTCLEIISETLVDIWIMDHDQDDEGGTINGPLLEISAPFIESLSVTLSCPERRKLRLSNIPSEVVLTIEFFGHDAEISAEVMNNAKELLGSIHHVEEVELGANFLEVLSCVAITYGGYDQFPPSTMRTSLTVDTNRDELHYVHGILGLLQSSPNLQELVVQGEVYEREPYNYNCAPANGNQLSDLLQLKTVVIKNFVPPNHAGEPMLTLVRILLKRTPVLEKIVIYDKEIIKSSPALDPFTILETMLGYPRSSQKASILLS